MELHAAQRDERAGYQYDDVDFFVVLGALDANGKGVGAVTMSTGARTRFDAALLDVACGVVGGRVAARERYVQVYYLSRPATSARVSHRGRRRQQAQCVRQWQQQPQAALQRSRSLV